MFITILQSTITDNEDCELPDPTLLCVIAQGKTLDTGLPDSIKGRTITNRVSWN